MGYVLNEEQRDIVKMVADFASNEIKPRCAEWDVSGEFPMDLYKMAFEMGLHCMEIPEEFQKNAECLITNLGRKDFGKKVVLKPYEAFVLYRNL